MLVLHILPGRVRAKHHGLYDKRLSQYLCVYCDNLYGVKSCRVNCHSATILILFDADKINERVLLEHIERAVHTKHDKMDLTPYDHYLSLMSKRNRAKRWFLIYGITYILFKIKQGFFGKFSISSNVRVLGVASVVTIVGGYPLIKGAYKRFARYLPTDADLLLSLTGLSFTILRESTKGVLVLLLKEFSDYIKYSAEVQCSRMLRQNTGKTSVMAYLRTDGDLLLTPVQNLCLGDCIEVHKGEILSVDGEVVSGRAMVNSLYCTGQPLVSRVADGNLVFDGMSVLTGQLTVRVTKLPESNEKADLCVDDIGLYRHIQEYITHITYVSLGAAGLYYLVTHSFLSSLAIMLVLNPSAAGTAFSSGLKQYISLLDRNHVFIRHPNVMEKLVRIDHIIFDKTGTLTCGIMKIRGIELMDPSYTQSELLTICAACEADSFHPISITLQTASENYDIENVQSSVLLPSKGVVAQYENKNVLIGNQELMREYGINVCKGIYRYQNWEERLCTPVFVAIDNVLVGIIVLEDVLRDRARELIRKLKYRGIGNITLLTGDSTPKARHVASVLGIPNVYSSCTAEDKVNIVNRMKGEGTVMMVGDGVNDVLSMAAADVSTSFLDSSCDRVKLHSDCIIFEEDMTRLPDLISLSQKSYQHIQQSVLASNLYNIVFGILACFQCFDIFAAKSFNTLNSLMVLLLNQGIAFRSPGKIRRKHPKIKKLSAGTNPMMAE